MASPRQSDETILPRRAATMNGNALLARRAAMIASALIRRSAPGNREEVAGAPGALIARPFDRPIGAEQTVPPIDEDAEIVLAHVEVVMEPVHRPLHPEDEVGVGVLELMRIRG